MRNAGVDETQTGIMMVGRNINNPRHADNTTFMAESKEELKSLLKQVKEDSENTDLKLNIQKTKIMASSSVFGLQKSLQMMTATMKLKDVCSFDKPRQHIKSRHITLPTKVCIVKATAFPGVTCRVRAEPYRMPKN